MISPNYERLCGHTKITHTRNDFQALCQGIQLQLGYHNNLEFNTNQPYSTHYDIKLYQVLSVYERKVLDPSPFRYHYCRLPPFVLCTSRQFKPSDCITKPYLLIDFIIKLFIWSTPNCSPYFYCVNPYRLPHEVPPFPANLQQPAVSSGIKWFLDESNCIYIAARVRVTKPTQIAHTKQVFY